MPESLLTILKFFFLALLWLFFVRVLRAVWAELRTPAAAVAVAAPTAARGDRGVATRLRVVDPADQRGRVFEVSEEMTLGRAAGCGIALEHDKTVSQLHARVFRRDGRLFVEDLGSTNGTYVNAKRLATVTAVGRGDRIQVGRTVLEVTR